MGLSGDDQSTNPWRGLCVEEKDEAEEEEEGMVEVSWLRGGRKRWHRRRTNFWHGRTKTTTTGTEGILRGPKKYFEQRHCLNKGIVPM